jgi:hypothetical protein
VDSSTACRALGIRSISRTILPTAMPPLGLLRRGRFGVGNIGWKGIIVLMSMSLWVAMVQLTGHSGHMPRWDAATDPAWSRETLETPC